MRHGEPGREGREGRSRRERNPRRGASSSPAKPWRRAKRPDADEGLEVEAVMAWQPGFAWVSAAPATAWGHGLSDEGGAAAAGEKPLNGDRNPGRGGRMEQACRAGWRSKPSRGCESLRTERSGGLDARRGEWTPLGDVARRAETQSGEVRAERPRAG